LPASSSNKKTVLLVDDHALVRKGLAELIDAEGDLRVCGQAADASTALTLTRRLRPSLVIIDLMLREGTGLELIKQIAALDSEIKMIVCSMHDEALYAERVLAAGAMGYVSKQEPSRVVLEAIRTVLSGRIYASEDVADRLLRKVSGRTREHEGSPVDSLSDRELEVLTLLGQGLNTRAIADQLKLSTKTIDTYREHIKTKLGLKNANELLRFAVTWTLDPAAAEARSQAERS